MESSYSGSTDVLRVTMEVRFRKTKCTRHYRVHTPKSFQRSTENVSNYLSAVEGGIANTLFHTYNGCYSAHPDDRRKDLRTSGSLSCLTYSLSY